MATSFAPPPSLQESTLSNNSKNSRWWLRLESVQNAAEEFHAQRWLRRVAGGRDQRRGATTINFHRLRFVQESQLVKFGQTRQMLAACALGKRQFVGAQHTSVDAVAQLVVLLGQVSRKHGDEHARPGWEHVGGQEQTPRTAAAGVVDGVLRGIELKLHRLVGTSIFRYHHEPRVVFQEVQHKHWLLGEPVGQHWGFLALRHHQRNDCRAQQTLKKRKVVENISGTVDRLKLYGNIVGLY